ncbi:3-hydroxyacyl-CoA dehydrogenase family protein [Xylophilus sp. GOD-11R]|uniref:3-hydroxyacyl-CoA dehydrogenase family protein n=1 Tax=Xylophilus sp. GOD-11R TaxID=3089814 RepID=UPI00298C86CB|nr:3-hydroxyacyl-CoA dehydrogenase family protein [Xylophilus sp. GOD-11R]WPB59232.1 3-hydroxyacyl-CoA dehydrogenase family protein [Xylophilus sp. GOD-11R]
MDAYRHCAACESTVQAAERIFRVSIVMTEKKTQGLVAIAGAGLMGCGIACRFALAGFEVLVYDSDPSAPSRTKHHCHAVYQEMDQAGVITVEQARVAESMIRHVESPVEFGKAELVLEAIVESVAAKRALYAELEAVLPQTTILASNTSGFPPDLLSEQMQHRDRFLIAHFWNPPHLIPLVEVVPGSDTAPAVVERVMALLQAIHAEPVALKAAIAGFIGNRLQFAVLREALHIVRSGVATPAEVDAVMKASLGRRYSIVGPLESADLGGLKTLLSIAEHLMPQLAKDEDVLELMRERVDQGDVGVATGQGFYRWDQDRIEKIQALRRRQLAATD